MVTREEVYKVIDSERAYQDSLFTGNGRFSDRRSREIPKFDVSAEILMAEEYLAKARTAWTNEYSDTPSLHQLRKVVALLVRAMENHGAPRREGF